MHADGVRRALGARHDHGVERRRAVPDPNRPRRVEQAAHALLAVASVDADVELREVEAEDLDPPPQRGEAAVGDPGAAVARRLRSSDGEIVREHASTVA